MPNKPYAPDPLEFDAELNLPPCEIGVRFVLMSSISAIDRVIGHIMLVIVNKSLLKQVNFLAKFRER